MQLGTASCVGAAAGGKRCGASYGRLVEGLLAVQELLQSGNACYGFKSTACMMTSACRVRL